MQDQSQKKNAFFFSIKQLAGWITASHFNNGLGTNPEGISKILRAKGTYPWAQVHSQQWEHYQ
jgi:hypothetical protein